MASQELIDLRVRADWKGCEAHLNQVLANDPTDWEAWFCLSESFGQQQRWQEAEYAAKRSVSLNPCQYQAWVFLGNAFAGQGQWAAVESAARRALEIAPGVPQAHWLLSHAAMAKGDWKTAWASSEYGYLCDRRKMRAIPHKILNDQDVKGKTLYIYGEQGQGDVIQYARFVPILREMGAKVIFEVRASLLNLVDGLADMTIAEAQDKYTPFQFDYHCPVMSLPHRMGLSTEHISGKPYLFFAPRPDVEGKVGLCWRGFSGHGNDSNRSMPHEAIEPLKGMADFVGLQPGHECPEWLPRCPVSDFASTASAIAGMKAVVTVDTSTAHVAGALGIPTLMFAAKNYTEARWGSFEKTPWYDSWQIVHGPDFDNIAPVVEKFLAGLDNGS